MCPRNISHQNASPSDMFHINGKPTGSPPRGTIGIPSHLHKAGIVGSELSEAQLLGNLRHIHPRLAEATGWGGVVADKKYEDYQMVGYPK